MQAGNTTLISATEGYNRSEVAALVFTLAGPQQLCLHAQRMAAVTAEQFSLFEIPASEPKRVKTKWQELAEMSKVDEEAGGLVPIFVAAALLDVSHQRVSQMLESGRLQHWVFFDRKFVGVNDLADYVNSERKGGRPVSDPPTTLKESLRRVRKLRGTK